MAAEVIRQDEKRLGKGAHGFGEKQFSEAFPSTTEHEDKFFGPCSVGEDMLNLLRGTLKQDTSPKKYVGL